MSTFVPLLLAVVWVYISTSECATTSFTREQLVQWRHYKDVYGKSYRSPAEEMKRMAIFFENEKYVEEHNKKFLSGESHFSLKLNKFADMTDEELAVPGFVDIKSINRPEDLDLSDEADTGLIHGGQVNGREVIMVRSIRNARDDISMRHVARVFASGGSHSQATAMVLLAPVLLYFYARYQ